MMPECQTAIFAEPSSCYYALEYQLHAGQDAEALRDALRQFYRQSREGVECLLAFGPDSWSALVTDCELENFIPFHTIHGPDGRNAPGDQADVLVWIHGQSQDQVYDAARQADRALHELGTLELEVPGFRYHDSRDLTGFIDGTENPQGEEARRVALVPEGRMGAAGSFVLTQKWVHDLDAFNALSQGEQEGVIGRTKADSVELSAAPPSSHIRRTDVKVDGQALKIYRRSFPYGSMHEKGLYFLAFSAELIRFAIQLDRMFGCAGDGEYDQLTNYSQPVSGSYWYAPTADFLHDMLM